MAMATAAMYGQQGALIGPFDHLAGATADLVVGTAASFQVVCFIIIIRI